MNTLGYRSTEDNGLSFELLVDGQPLGTLIGSQNNAIPFWIVEDDLPYWPPHGRQHDPEIRIVTVCDCGEYGCGHAQCRVIRHGGEVVFRDFDINVSLEGRKQEFCFTRANFDAVIADIVRLAKEFAERERQRRERRPRRKHRTNGEIA